jgi:hypothetical protein
MINGNGCGVKGQSNVDLFPKPPSDFQTPVPSTYFAPNFVVQVCAKKVFLVFVKFHKSSLSPKF